ncbi:hypothetical protein ACOSQ2_014657 [Xanthoceras sorbifolium]
MNLVAKLLEQQNRSLANMNRGGNAHRRKRNAEGQGNVLGPPAFMGTSDPLDATCHILRTTLQENDSITWEMFMNALNNKYFPDRVRFNIERDFLNLKQGSKIVAEYEEQFTSFNGRCFLDGLHPYIQSRVEVLKLGRYADIIDQALIASRSMKEFKKAREAYRNINFRGGSSNGNASKQGSQFRN